MLDLEDIRKRVADAHDEVVMVLEELEAAKEKIRDREGERAAILHAPGRTSRNYLNRARKALGTADRELRKSTDPRAGTPKAPIPRRRGASLRKANR